MISYLVPDCSRTFLNSIYKSNFFYKGIFEIISPFKSLNLLCWNSILEYLAFNLFILDCFGLFSFGFRLSVHLELTSKSRDQKLLKDLC